MFVALNPKPSDLTMDRLKVGLADRRIEPVRVAKRWDDLWLGVKDQSNSEIAGSLRNLFK